MSSTFLHNSSLCIIQCRNINSLVQSTSTTQLFPVYGGQISIVILTMFCHDNSFLESKFLTKISSLVVVFFIDSIDSNSSAISEIPRTKMSSCAVSSNASENSWNECTRSLPITSMRRATVHLDKLTSSNSFCIMDRLNQPHRTWIFKKVRYRWMECYV